jgi:hypothetical protein
METLKIMKNNGAQQVPVTLTSNKDAEVISRIIEEYASFSGASLIRSDGDRLEQMRKKQKEAKELAESLGASNTLQAMLATQMAAIHDAQQVYSTLAKLSVNDCRITEQQHYANVLTKLSNVFIQQAALMHKLQGHGQQKVIVEHVHVHPGAQAIVGQVNSNKRGADNGKNEN